MRRVKVDHRLTTELFLVAGGLRSVVQQPHRDRSVLGQDVENVGGAVPGFRETAAEDLEECLDEMHHLRLVGHDGLPEFIGGQGFGPQIGTYGEASGIGMIGRDLRADNERLDRFG